MLDIAVRDEASLQLAYRTRQRWRPCRTPFPAEQMLGIVARIPLGVKLLKSYSAERALPTLFEVTTPRRTDDPKGETWKEEFSRAT